MYLASVTPLLNISLLTTKQALKAVCSFYSIENLNYEHAKSSVQSIKIILWYTDEVRSILLLFDVRILNLVTDQAW